MNPLALSCEQCFGLMTDCAFCGSAAGEAQSSTMIWELDPNLADVNQLLIEDHDSGSYAVKTTCAKLSLSSDPVSTSTTSILSGLLAATEQELPPVREEVPSYRRHTKSKAQIKLLNEWFHQNPGPTSSQLSEYARLSGLEKDQVRNWFVNQRRRRPKNKSPVCKSNSGKKTPAKPDCESIFMTLFYIPG
jgi:hypothetical protein